MPGGRNNIGIPSDRYGQLLPTGRPNFNIELAIPAGRNPNIVTVPRSMNDVGIGDRSQIDYMSSITT